MRRPLSRVPKFDTFQLRENPELARTEGTLAGGPDFSAEQASRTPKQPTSQMPDVYECL